MLLFVAIRSRTLLRQKSILTRKEESHLARKKVRENLLPKTVCKKTVFPAPVSAPVDKTNKIDPVRHSKARKLALTGAPLFDRRRDAKGHPFSQDRSYKKYGKFHWNFAAPCERWADGVVIGKPNHKQPCGELIPTPVVSHRSDDFNFYRIVGKSLIRVKATNLNFAIRKNYEFLGHYDPRKANYLARHNLTDCGLRTILRARWLVETIPCNEKRYTERYRS